MLRKSVPIVSVEMVLTINAALPQCLDEPLHRRFLRIASLIYGGCPLEGQPCYLQRYPLPEQTKIFNTQIRISRQQQLSIVELIGYISRETQDSQQLFKSELNRMNNHSLPPFMSHGQNIINAQQQHLAAQQQAQDNRIFFDDFSPSSNMNGEELPHMQFPYSSKGVPILQKELFRTKRSYVPVELDKRAQLIRAVEDEGLTIKEAAQNLKINYSTAKHIVKIYKRTGEIQTQIMSKRLPERDLRTLEVMTMNGIGLQSNQGQWINPSMFGNNQMYGHSLPSQNQHQILTLNSAGQNFASLGLNQQLANYGRTQGLQNSFGQFQNQPDQMISSMQNKRLKPNGDLNNDHQFFFGQYNNSRANELSQASNGMQLQMQQQDSTQTLQKQGGNQMNPTSQNFGGAVGLVGSTKGPSQLAMNMGGQVGGIPSYVSFPGALGMSLNQSQPGSTASSAQFQMNFAPSSAPLHFDNFGQFNAHGFGQGSSNFLQQPQITSKMQSGAQSQLVPKINQNSLLNNSTASELVFANPGTLGSAKLGAFQGPLPAQTNQNPIKQEISGFQNANSSLQMGSHTPSNQNGAGSVSSPQTGRPQPALQSQSAQQAMQHALQNQSEGSQNPSYDASSANFKNPLPKNPSTQQTLMQQAQNSIGLLGSIPQVPLLLNSGNTFSICNSAQQTNNSTNSSIPPTSNTLQPNNSNLHALFTQSSKLPGQAENKLGGSSLNSGLHPGNSSLSGNQSSTGSSCISGLNLASSIASQANNIQSLIDQQNKSQLLMQSGIAPQQRQQQSMVLPQNGPNRSMIPSNQFLPGQPHNLLLAGAPQSQGGFGYLGQSQNITPQQFAMVKNLNIGSQASLSDQILAAQQCPKQQAVGSAALGAHYLQDKNGQSNVAAESSSSSNVHIQQQQLQNQNSNTLTASPVLSTGGK